MRDLLSSFWTDECGQGMAEYSVLIALITIVLIGVIGPLRTAVGVMFTEVTGVLGAVVSAS